MWNYSKWDTEFCILFSTLYHPPSATEIWLEAFRNLCVCGQIQHYPWSLTSCSDTFWLESLWLSDGQNGLDTTVSLSLNSDVSRSPFVTRRDELGRRKETWIPWADWVACSCRLHWNKQTCLATVEGKHSSFVATSVTRIQSLSRHLWLLLEPTSHPYEAENTDHLQICGLKCAAERVNLTFSVNQLRWGSLESRRWPGAYTCVCTPVCVHLCVCSIHTGVHAGLLQRYQCGHYLSLSACCLSL